MGKVWSAALCASLVAASGCAGDRVEYAGGVREGALACRINTSDGPEVVPGQTVLITVDITGDGEIGGIDLVRKWNGVSSLQIAPSEPPFSHETEAEIPAAARDGDRVEFTAVAVTADSKDPKYFASGSVAFDVVDVTRPTVSVTLSAPGPGGYKGGDAVSVLVAAEDPNSGVGSVAVTLIGPVSPKSFADQFAPPETEVSREYQTTIDETATCGRILVLVEAADGAAVPNSKRAEAVVSLAGGVADSAAPTVTIDSPGEGATVRPGDEVAVAVTATDDCGPVTETGYSVSGAATAEGTVAIPAGGTNPAVSEFKFTVPTDAAHGAGIEVSVWAVDASGKTGESSPVTTDLVVSSPQAPTIAITSPANNASAVPGGSVLVNVSAGSVTGKVTSLTLSASGAMTETQDFAVDPASADVKHSFPLNIPGTLNDGDSVVLTATASDDSIPALMGTSASVTLKIAVETPSVTLLFPADGQTFNPGSSPRISVKADQRGAPIAKVGYTAEGVVDASEEFTVDPAAASTQHDFFLSVPSGAPEGDIAIIGTAADQDGKPGSSKTVTMHVKDKTPPTVTILAPIENQAFSKGGTMKVTARAVDASSNVASITITVSGAFSDSKVLAANGKDFTGSWDFAVPPAATTGDVFVFVKATDAAAQPNASPVVSVKAKVN